MGGMQARVAYRTAVQQVLCIDFTGQAAALDQTDLVTRTGKCMGDRDTRRPGADDAQVGVVVVVAD